MAFREDLIICRLQLGMPGDPATPERDSWLNQLPVRCLALKELWQWRSAHARIVELWYLEWQDRYE